MSVLLLSAIQYYYGQITSGALHYTCDLTQYGTGWGRHALCGKVHDCRFASYGISTDYSFDKDLADNGCTGILLDPTVAYAREIYPGLVFLQKGAPMLENVTFDTLSPDDVLLDWSNSSRFVLKMDCEGCEYKLADVAADFWFGVEQLAIEIHVGRLWMKDVNHLHQLEKLLRNMRRAGLELMDASIGGCAPADEGHGCLHQFSSSAICAPGKMCQNLLFARPMQ
jgi:hypothetical protein